MGILLKLADKVRTMKNMRKRGRSARNGNAPSPYTKYQKVPFRYSSHYYEWFRHATRNKAQTSSSREKPRWKEAAE